MDTISVADETIIDSGQFRYRIRYLCHALRSMANDNRLLVRREMPVIKDQFRLTEEARMRWSRLFGVRPEEEDFTQFLYYTPISTIGLFELLAPMNVSIRKVLHLGTHLEFHGRMIPGREYTYVGRLEEVVRTRTDRATLSFVMEVLQDGEPVVTDRETFLVKDVPERTLDALGLARAGTGLGRMDVLWSKTDRVLFGAHELHEVEIDAAAVAEYGRVSGDMNMIHTNRLASRLFGYRRPFAHGLYMANLIMKLIACSRQRTIRSFSASFRRPSFLGQVVSVRHDESRFSVCGADGTILIFGLWS